MPIITNNDVQDWYNKLNKKVNHRSPIYLLVTALHNEASQIPINIELLEIKCWRRRQRKKNMFDFIKNWVLERLQKRKCARKFLNACSDLLSEVI